MSLPLLVSVPHGGLQVPDLVADRCLLSPEEIAADGDVGAASIYSIAAEVAVHVTTEVARAIVDVNRPVDDRAKDGVVKTHTCWDVPIYREPLPESLVQRLLEEHWQPYHARLRDGASHGVRLGLDLHTMAAFGPPVGPDPGAERPAACLGFGDGTCPRAWVERFAAILGRVLGRRVTINDPFRGGYITRNHAAELPWMQVELSRAPWLTEVQKRARFLEALTELARSL